MGGVKPLDIRSASPKVVDANIGTTLQDGVFASAPEHNLTSLQGARHHDSFLLEYSSNVCLNELNQTLLAEPAVCARNSLGTKQKSMVSLAAAS